MFSPPGIYILLVALLLIVGIVFLYLVIRKARRNAASTEIVPAGDESGDSAQFSSSSSSAALKLSFIKANRRVRAYGRGSRYRVPWYLMIGEADSGKTTLLGNTGMELLSNPPDEQQTGVKQGLNWFFFDRGIVLDASGDFVLRADGATSNSGGWNYLARLLRRYRPERPLDGIILTIPCSDLTRTTSQNPELKLKLERKAQHLYNKLVDTQKKLGLSLPVYVLLTKCDQLKGFKSLCSEVPERCDEMFGWSSPYTREVAYRAEWVREAFQNLQYYLFQLQIEVFTQHDRVSNRDEFFMLPSEVRDMRASLQVYLDQIFKESAYHEPFFLRGIYLCGDSAREVVTSSVVFEPTEQKIDWRLTPPKASQLIVATTTTAEIVVEKKHAFLGHLFERKIFQEALLARPIARTALSRNRWVLTAQVLSLAIPILGVLGILVTYPSLREREATFYTYLTREERDLNAIKAEKASGFLDDQSRNRESQLFEAMSSMSGKKLISPFIPGSWFSYVTEESANSISDGYPFIVYDSLRRRLDCRTEAKLVALPSSCFAAVTTGTEPTVVSNCAEESDPSLKYVNTYIVSFNELLVSRARYNQLTKDDGRNLDDLNKLLLYFDHAPVPAGFDTNNSLFVAALRKAQPPALRTSEQAARAMAACKVEGMINDIYEQTFQGDSVSYLHLGDITKTENLFSQAGNAWLATSVFEDPSPFVGMTLSEGVSELKRALNDLSRERLQSRDAERKSSTEADASPQYSHQSGAARVWDKATLQQAIDSYDKYSKFTESNSYKREETLDYRVKQVALADLRRTLEAIVPRALGTQVPVRSPDESAQRARLQTEIKSLENAQELLSKLVDICRRVGSRCWQTTGSSQSLREVLVRQTASLMKDVDVEFNSSGFYFMSRENFSWWTLNDEFHAYIVFGAGNPDELEAYLAAQREEIAALAREYAAPVLKFMAALNIPAPGYAKWKQILDQLDKYDAKKPGNTVALLENFIRVEMDKVKLNNCSAIIAGSTPAPLDYFITRRNALRQPFYERCLQLASAEAEKMRRLEIEKQRKERELKVEAFYQGLETYREIQTAFTTYLEGKFPFSDVPKAEPFGEVEPESLVSFFEVFTKNRDPAISILNQAQDGFSKTQALLFLERMETVRLLFAAFLEKKQQYPAFDFNLRFRVNKDTPQEIGANEIIDWTFSAGGTRFLYREQDEKPPEGIWGYGSPLTLTLRWANDSPTIPSAAFPVQSHMKLEGKTVTLRYDNNWSLLLLLLKHKGGPADFEQGVDVAPYTIKFEVPTVANPNLSNILQQAQRVSLKNPVAEVFIRISLLTPSKKDPLILPDVFPTYAPQLTSRPRSVLEPSK